MPNRKSVKRIDTAAPVPADGDTAAVAADNGQTTPPAAVSATPAMTALSAALTAHTGRTTAELAQAAKVGHSTAAKILASLEKRGTVRRIKGGMRSGRVVPDRWEPVPSTEPDGSAAAEPRADAPECEPAATAESETAVEGVAAEAEPQTSQKAEPVEAGETMVATESPTSAETTPEPQANAEPQAAVEPEATKPTKRGGKARAEKTKAEEVSPDDSARLRPGALRDMVTEHMRAHPQEEFSPSALGKTLDRSSGAIANALEKLEADSIVSQTSVKPRRYRYLGSGKKTS